MLLRKVFGNINDNLARVIGAESPYEYHEALPVFKEQLAATTLNYKDASDLADRISEMEYTLTTTLFYHNYLLSAYCHSLKLFSEPIISEKREIENLTEILRLVKEPKLFRKFKDKALADKLGSLLYCKPGNRVSFELDIPVSFLAAFSEATEKEIIDTIQENPDLTKIPLKIILRDERNYIQQLVRPK
jgi:hypothetical protein